LEDPDHSRQGSRHADRSDNGIGMTREAIVSNSAPSPDPAPASSSAASSKRTPRSDRADRPVGVGSMHPSWRPTVSPSFPAPPAKALPVKWESDGQGEYTVEDYDKPTRGPM